MAIPFLLKKLLVRSGIARFLPISRRLTDGSPEYLRYYSDRVLAAPIEELLDPATFPEPPGPEVLHLNLAAPQFDSPVTSGRVLADRFGNPPLRGLPALREAVAEITRRGDGRELDPGEEILVTHGARGAYAAVLDAFVNPGRKVVLFDPCSPLFALGAQSRRARIRWVPTQTVEGRLRFDPAVLARALRGATLLVLTDPASPTGATLTPDDLEQIAAAAEQADVLLYLDQSFARFRYEDPSPRLAALPGVSRRILTAGSLTQGYGLGSTRVGWLAGPRHLIRACALTAGLSAPYVSTLSQQVAVRALSAEEELFGPVREEFRSRRQYAFDKLRAMGLEPSWPSGGYFFWVPVRSLGFDGRTFAERLLRERQVLVGPGCAFGPSGTDHIRISFAVEDGRLREGLVRLAAFLASLKQEPLVQSATVPVPPADEEADTPPKEDRIPTFSRV